MKPRNATLVVIEYGASWPRWLDPSHSGDMAVVAQHYEGEPSSLITQVASRVTRPLYRYHATTSRQKVRPTSVFLVCRRGA